MKPLTTLIAAALIATPLAATAPRTAALAQPATPAAAGLATAEVTAANNDVFRRLLSANAGLKSYHAAIHADVAFHSFPYIATTLDGDVYFKQPDRQAVVFQTVPLLAAQFKKVYPNVPAPSRWSSIYTIGSLGDSGGATTFRLVPKRHGRVEHLDVRVDDAAATISSYTWTYEEGGDITFDQTFKTIGGYPVVVGQTGKVNLPQYKADVTSTISNYRLNVAVEDSVFAE